MLEQLLCALDYMECELQYRLTPLPELCRLAGIQVKRTIGKILVALSEELESQISPDVASCMQSVLIRWGPLPERTAGNLHLLGSSLGRFDLEGQIHGMESLRHYCREDLKQIKGERDSHRRSCQTLGLCAGAALVILFI